MKKSTVDKEFIRLKNYALLFFVFLANENVFAKTILHNSSKIKPLVLSLNQLNDEIFSYGSTSNSKCRSEVFDDQDFAHSQEYYNKSEESLLNLIEHLSNNNLVDKAGRAFTQFETNKIVGKIQQLQLGNDYLEKVSNQISSNKKIALKTRSQIVGIINDIKSVQNQMNAYRELGSVSCYFAFDDDMKKNVGSNSALYHNGQFSKEEKSYFEMDDNIIVGKCKGRGLLILPEFQTQR